MSQLRLGINGFGRIGRTVLREFLKRQNEGKFQNVEVVALNNPGDLESFARLFKYDSVGGVWPEDVTLEGNNLKIGNRTLFFNNSPSPAEIGWDKHNVDIVIDSTGFFKDKAGLSQHIYGTVKKVIMCAPGKDLDGTFVFGINHETYNASEHHVVSNASCTTNCLAPVAKTLHEAFGIEQGLMTTVHAYTSDQNLLDGAHSDPRRARAAAMNMIPTTTGAAQAVGVVLPELNGKLHGFAVRVPTPNVSMVDLTFTATKELSVEAVNNAIREAANGPLKGVLAYEDQPLVSGDFMGNPNSSIFDTALTMTMGKQAKIVSWYDNEVGFSNRVLDLANYIGSKF